MRKSNFYEPFFVRCLIFYLLYDKMKPIESTRGTFVNVGQKIKRLRTAKMMTQSELVGGEITRNMLSRIENGAANPSLETIQYIAGRLNVSPGFLLADEADEQIYLKHNEISNIKRAFMTEDYRICRDMCMNARSNTDDEIQFVLAECNLAIAIEEFNSGNLRHACEYFDEALECCEKTIYRTDSVVAFVGIYFRYMRRLSATLASNVIDEGEVNIYPSLTDAFCRYAYALEQTELKNDVYVREPGRKESPFTLHLEAKKQMEVGDYRSAYEMLHSILVGESAIPEPILYFVFCDLEICCREIQEFRGAYEYSINKIELLQKLLT